MKNPLNHQQIKTGFDEFLNSDFTDSIEYRATNMSLDILHYVEKNMKAKGWTKTDLAKAIGTSSSYLTQLFQADRILNLKTIAKFEKALSYKFRIHDEFDLSIKIDEIKQILETAFESKLEEKNKVVARKPGKTLTTLELYQPDDSTDWKKAS